jgi:hypothetical protein
MRKRLLLVIWPLRRGIVARGRLWKLKASKLGNVLTTAAPSE